MHSMHSALPAPVHGQESSTYAEEQEWYDSDKFYIFDIFVTI